MEADEEDEVEEEEKEEEHEEDEDTPEREVPLPQQYTTYNNIYSLGGSIDTMNDLATP